MNALARFGGSVLAILVPAGAFLLYHSTSVAQVGDRGVGMQVVDSKINLAEKVEANSNLPPNIPPASHDGVLAVDAYKNVRVMGHLSSAEFTRLMTMMTLWVAPNQGCGYCHAPERDKDGKVVVNEDGYPQADLNKMWSDELYTKVVARRMLQMTLHINGDWKQHVQQTGVTCYTCHRGNPVPANLWYLQPPNDKSDRAMGDNAGQNSPAAIVGNTSLPHDPYAAFLLDDSNNIRVNSTEALPNDNNHSSIKQAEYTWGFMMTISKGLGVNCTYCHNSRSPEEWQESPPQRATAWYGIRMARDLNTNYLIPLQSTFPANRLGELGDAPKLNCATCHQGAFKPLLGVSMLKDNMILAEAKPQPAKSVPAEAAAPSAATDGGAPQAGAAGLADGGVTLTTGDAGAPARNKNADAGPAPKDGGAGHP